jgi:hypothetical protein
MAQQAQQIPILDQLLDQTEIGESYIQSYREAKSEGRLEEVWNFERDLVRCLYNHFWPQQPPAQPLPVLDPRLNGLQLPQLIGLSKNMKHQAEQEYLRAAVASDQIARDAGTKILLVAPGTSLMYCSLFDRPLGNPAVGQPNHIVDIYSKPSTSRLHGPRNLTMRAQLAERPSFTGDRHDFAIGMNTDDAKYLWGKKMTVREYGRKECEVDVKNGALLKVECVIRKHGYS